MDDFRPGRGNGQRGPVFSRPTVPVRPERTFNPPTRGPAPVALRPTNPSSQSEPPRPHKINVPKQRTRRSVPKLVIIIAIILGLAGTGFGVYTFALKKDPPAPTVNKVNVTTPEPQAPVAAAPAKKTLRIIAGGDMLAHDAINKAAKTPAGYDYLPFMKNFQPYFAKADVRFCVQGVPAGGESFGISGYPVFNAPLQFTRDMALLGCNVINTGTNHSNDKGQPLIDANAKAWDTQPGVLAVAGSNRSAEEQQKIRYFEKDGLKFAFLSYVTYNNTTPQTPYGVNTFNEETAKRELAEVRSKVDIVLVSMRWGTEYSPDINARQDQLGNFLAANGADVVFGHGQHVQGPVKRIARPDGKETIVWYGIGNFVNAQLPPETLFNGVPIVDIDIATKKVAKLAFLPFYMHYEWTPAQKAREDLLSRTNFQMYTFEQAAEPLAKSQNRTTIADQTKRLTDVLNKFTPVQILKSSEY